MDYQKVYNQLIEKAKSENRKKLKRDNKNYVYYENHHILPKCLCGEDKKENLVLLAAKEHFIAHKLLVEIYPNESKLVYALHLLIFSKSKGQERNFVISSREYERIRYLNAKQNSIRFSGKNNPMYGKVGANKGIPKSEETINKIKESKRLNKKEVECPYCGVIMDISNAHKYHFENCLLSGNKDVVEKRKHSKETIELMKRSNSGEKNGMYGKNHSKQTIKKIIESNKKTPKIKCDFCKKSFKKGHFVQYHGEKCKKNPKYKPNILICPHCNKKGESSGMKVWHFDNCKYKTK